MAEARDVLTLIDGEGSELLFEILDVIPYEGRFFAVLQPADAPDDEVTILEVLGDAPEDEYFEGISDAALLESVFVLFKQRMG